ncbi:Cytochrome P450 76A2 [Linum grandiflorum]
MAITTTDLAFLSSPNLFLPFLILSLTLSFFFLRRKSPPAPYPPGPRGWPIIGNLLDLGNMPHRTLTQMRQKYGDVVWLKFGATNTLAILSAKSAAEVFKNHDINFMNRTLTETTKSHDYHIGSLGLSPYGTYWRVLRRLVTVDMLVLRKINDSAPVRRRNVDNLIGWVSEEAEKSREMHVARFVFLTTFNLLGNLLLSRDLVGSDNSDEADRFFDAMLRLTEWSGHANVADFFPWLRWLDPQGLRKKMDRDLGIALGIASKFVKERISDGEASKKNKLEGDKKDFLDVMLEFRGNGKDEPDSFTEHQINIFLLEIFLAGSETTSSTVEWAMTELLRNPESMAKLKSELDKVVGPNRKVEESDIDDLPFLQATVKETFRLHPPLPLLVPRRVEEDTLFMGYHVPKGTQVLVNAWAIGRDPEAWEGDDTWSFRPERFLGSKVDFRGQHHQLIPFGAGRRVCAGLLLAHRMLHLVLGTLVHEFSWEVSVDPKDIDMDDRLGVTMRKSEPLMAMPKKIRG